MSTRQPMRIEVKVDQLFVRDVIATYMENSSCNEVMFAVAIGVGRHLTSLPPSAPSRPSVERLHATLYRMARILDDEMIDNKGPANDRT